MAYIKFNSKSILVYAVAQTSEGQSAVLSGVNSGTITVALAGTAVTGTSTAFTTELVVNDLLYNSTGTLIGKVTAITNDTSLTIDSAIVAITSGNFTNSAHRTSGTLTTLTNSDTITGVGTSFTRDLAIGAYVYTLTGAEIGIVKSVGSDTSATLEANAAVAISGDGFRTGLGAKNATATVDLSFSTEIDTEAFTYTGSELDRDEETIIKDIFSKYEFSAFLPVLGTIATPGAPPLTSEVPMVDLLGACGMALVLSNDTAKFTNSLPSEEFLTVEIRRSSSSITTDKVYTITDARGTVDKDVTISTRSKLKFNFDGNLSSVTQKPKLIANYGTQKSYIASIYDDKTITLAELQPYDSTGNPVTLSGPSNLCFEKVVSPNMGGFSFTRYATSCEKSWNKEAVPSDVTVTILEDQAYADYNPYDHLGEYHNLKLTVGTKTYRKVEMYYSKLQLANVPNSEVQAFAGQDLSFRNTGSLDIILT